MTNSREGKPSDGLRGDTFRAKKLELKLVTARLAQAEYHLESLVARCDFLEARCERGVATQNEREELDWALETLPGHTTKLIELAVAFEQLKRDVDFTSG